MSEERSPSAGRASTAALDQLDMSVLLPLQEERDAGERCVRAWTRGQDHPRDRYEVILLAPELEPELERAARDLVTPHDRWISIGFSTSDLGERRSLGLPVGVLSFEPR